MPPSPRLSARITSSTYLSVTISASDQKIIDRMPSTSQRMTPSCLKWSMLALKA